VITLEPHETVGLSRISVEFAAAILAAGLPADALFRSDDAVVMIRGCRRASARVVVTSAYRRDAEGARQANLILAVATGEHHAAEQKEREGSEVGNDSCHRQIPCTVD